MLAFGWASVAIAENGETLEDWQGDIIESDELESAAYKFVDLYREGGEMHEKLIAFPSTGHGFYQMDLEE